MDENRNFESNNISIEKDKQGKFTMDKKTFWIIAGIVIAILVILVVWQTAQINAISSGSTAKVASTAARASSGMVGGC